MRILIATATAGGGHLAAAAALEEAWRELRPRDTVETLDVVRFFSTLHRKVHADGYLKIVEKAPELWGFMFNKTDDPKTARKLPRLKKLFDAASGRKLLRQIQAFRPDAVLCTHYVPLEALNELRNGDVARPYVASVVTDFEAHALWMADCVDLYCVAAEHTKTRLLARGVPPEKLLVSGIPVSARFRQQPDKAAVRKGMGLRDDLPIVLVLSGGFGTGPVRQIALEVDRAAESFQTVVVTGRNAELRAELAVLDYKHPVRILGFATNMHELMAVADLIITKPGGLTTAEALAVGKPLLIVSPIPGQESANSDFLLEHGAGVKANRVEDLGHRVDELLGGRKLASMCRAAARLGRSEASLTICRAVAAGITKKPSRVGCEKPVCKQHSAMKPTA